MNQTEDETFHEISQEILAGAAANRDFQLSEFMSLVERELVESGQIEGFELCHYRNPGSGIRVDGFWMNEDDGIDLFIADYEGRESMESLTQSEIHQIIGRLGKFYTVSSKQKLYEDLEPASPAYGLSRAIYERRGDIGRLNLYILSERLLSKQFKQVEFSDGLSGIPVSFHIWDLGRLHRLRTARHAREPIEIDLREAWPGGVQCLKAHATSSFYQAYLLAIPGTLVADLYARYGSRLLEQNVRSFLQARGSVNKGIRDTIVDEPDMFFAYNNGITATASEVLVEPTADGLMLRKITDLQIVNGGQTTASLFQTRLRQKASLDDVYVQMKLSIVTPDIAETIVPKISEYANTQNKVNAADLFSNHPYHVRMEEFSRRIWAPAPSGQQRETKWFYERARGQFADAQSVLTVAEKKRFLAEFPKSQMFTKTDLAKYDNAWDEHPRFVNLGAQKNFAQFAKRMGQEWKANADQFGEEYFRRAIARAIIFKRTERIVTAQSWYSGGYRANIVAYSLALLARSQREGLFGVDFETVWFAQGTSQELDSEIARLSKIARDHLYDPPSGITNISEWAKREACWDRLLAKQKVN